MKLTTQFHLLLSSKICGAKPPLYNFTLRFTSEGEILYSDIAFSFTLKYFKLTYLS